MQFRDLNKQYQVLKPDIDEAVLKVMTEGNFISGKQVAELEQQLAEYVNVKHCITCANGTDALTLALKAWNIGPGDAVFVPDFTFFASGEVVSAEGATPVFVDVKRDTFNMDCQSLENAIEQIINEGELTPKVIIAVDLFGLPADYTAIRTVADRYGLKILEDGAQGFGGRIGEKKACSFGDISTTSFFPAKPLGCYGDGGAIFTDNDEWAAVIKSLCVHGKGTDKYDNIRIGMNSRLDTIQAAILSVKFNAFKDYELEDVNKVSNWYTERLCELVEVPRIPEGFYSSWAQYTILLPDIDMRNEMQKVLKEHGIPSMIYYSKPMHKQTAFENKHKQMVELPSTETLCNQVLSLPIHPYMKLEDVETIVKIVSKVISSRIK